MNAQTTILPAENTITWTQIGPGGGGAMTAIAIDPTDENIVYVGTDLGGIFKSTDGGKKFSAINKGLKNYVVQDIKIDPLSPNIVYLATAGGLYKSVDGGMNWSLKRNGFPQISKGDLSCPINALEIDPNKTNIIYAGVGKSLGNGHEIDAKYGKGLIYKSVDRGESWVIINSTKNNIDPKATIFDIAVSPNDSNKVFVTTDRGFYKSINGGKDWYRKSNGIPYTETRGLAINPQNPNIMYITVWFPISNEPWMGGVYKSTDAGETWTAKNNGLRNKNNPASPRLISNYTNVIINRKNPNIIYTSDWSWGGPGVYKTINSGESWFPIVFPGSNLHLSYSTNLSVGTMAISNSNPDVIYFGTGKNLYMSDNAGTSWQNADTKRINSELWQTTGIENTDVQTVVVDPQDPNLVYVGYADTSIFKTNDGGKTFKLADKGIEFVGHAYSIIVDPNDSNVVYVSGIGKRSVIAKSVDRGDNWTIINDGIQRIPDLAKIYSMVLDPKSPKESRTIYAAAYSYGVYKSTNEGRDWVAINNGLPDNPRVRALVVHPQNPEILFLAINTKGSNGPKDYGGVYKSINAGQSWIKIDNDRIPDVWSIAVSSQNPSIIYVGARNYWDSANNRFFPGGCYKSIDGGNNWSRIFDSNWISSIAINPQNHDIVYAGELDGSYHDEYWCNGIYKSVDGGKNWRLMNNNLPNIKISVITISESNPEIIYIGTGGGGVFKGIDSQVIEFNRNLNQGWNLISIPIQLSDMNLSEVLRSIKGDFESVWTFDSVWKQYNVELPDWANDLYIIEPGKGYWINMFRQSTLKIIGKPLDNHAIYLDKGWNLVGYNMIMSIPIENALSSISNYYESVWTYDKEFKVHYKNKPLNSLVIMKPGEGYWIKALDKCEWYINRPFLLQIE